uniref:Type I polyketide synthase n=1 Tax=Gambierdiscus excentricus TaxID=986170 RepID=A0A1S6K859_9DINO|nr:type I polyketide synthase [Gambierdiscus excentricus]
MASADGLPCACHMDAYEPIVAGLRLGALVEIHGLDSKQLAALEQDFNGQFGQLVSYNGDTKKFHVCCINGARGDFSPKNVRAASDAMQSNAGVDANSFDVIMGPKTQTEAWGSEIAQCIMEKGFCVVKYCESDTFVRQALEMLHKAGEDGLLGRLAEEVEEGCLGKECKGKCAWLEESAPQPPRLDGTSRSSPKGAQFSQEPALVDSKRMLSLMAEQLLDYSDIFDSRLEEMSTPLICLTLADKEEQDYPHVEPKDAAMLTFLRIWRRTLVRAVHFMGPGTASITLDAKNLGRNQRQVRIQAAPHTFVLVDTAHFVYTCSCPEETLMLITNFLSASDEYEFEGVTGNLHWLMAEGPQPPPGDNAVHAVNLAMRLPAFQDSGLAYFSGLTAALDAVVEIPFTRWDLEDYYCSDEVNFDAEQTTTKHQSFCEGAELFDYKYFEISHAEASGMDPVQRLLLEAGAQSLMSIGLTKKITNRKSVHAGFAVGNDKLDWATCPKMQEFPQPSHGPSSSLSVIANRFSFVFNLKGPNFVCDTACSAALSSTHMVKMMMTERKFDPLEWFLTMGAHLCLSPTPFIGTSQAHMTSPKGRSFTFNAHADGYCRGEGICGFMVKYGNYRQSSESLAMLRATQVGQDGRSASLTAPNGPAQEELIKRAIKEGAMTPPESTVWECHGTGTSLGDPIEVGAVRKVMIQMERSETLLIASNKTNIGHLEGAAAMGSMCKCILQCQHGMCNATLHLKIYNAHLDHGQQSFDGGLPGGFLAEFAVEPQSFRYLQGHSQASSFGLGGTNGHAIFWGENLGGQLPVRKQFEQRYRAKPPPEVRPLGKNYDEWEADFPDSRCLNDYTFPSDKKKYVIRFSPDDPHDQSVVWEPVDEVEPEVDDDESFFTIAGDHKNYEEERMVAGDVPGVWLYTASIPERNVLHFRLMKNGEVDKGIGPKVDNCARRSEVIIGPGKEVRTKWAVFGRAGTKVHIEFFSRRGLKSITWFIGKN